MFKDDQTADVVTAVKELIQELEFPPTIADVKKKVNHYVWQRKWIQELEDKEREEQESREKFLKRQEELKLLDKPKLSKEEQQKYIANVKKAIRGVKNDKV